MSYNIDDLYELIQKQIDKMNDIEKKLEAVNAEVSVLKSRPMTIEYKFDQLKVETLEGTLNIGIQPPNNGSSNGTSGIEDFSVQQKPPTIGKMAPPLTLTPEFAEQVAQQLYVYLDNEGQKRIQELAAQQQRTVEAGYEHFMMDDIKTQIEMRIPYYFNLIAQQFPHLLEHREQFVEQMLVHMKQDIDQAFIIFIQKMKSG